MRTFTFHKPHHLGQLHDEILAAIPALRPVRNRDGDRVAVMQVEGLQADHSVRITVPVSVSQELLQSVVDAHVADPTYGAMPRLSESDLLGLVENDFRKWVFGALGLR